MKVVKCLKHLDKRFWGKVVEDGSDFKPSDTFPLPEQGDKVKVSDDGKNWSEYSDWYFSSYLKILSDPYIVYDEDRDTPSSFKYIRPIEKKEIETPKLTNRK